MSKITKFIKTLCMAVGGIVIICGLLALLISWYNRDRLALTDNTALVIDFADSISENAESDLFNELLEKPHINLHKLVQAIDLAAHDKHIKALVAYINTSDLELAQIQDVARAVWRFRQSGKPAYAFSQGFGVLGQGNREYYLASIFDKIYMQPHTTIGLTGISIEVPFLRPLLDKLGVYTEFYTRYEYKTAMMSLTDGKISPAYKKEMSNLGDGLMQVLKGDIVENRGLKDIDGIINQAPLSAEKGVELGLVDELLYLPQLEEKLKKEGIGGFISVIDYASAIQPNAGDLPVIAYLNLHGVINTGENSDDFDGKMQIGSRDVLADIAEIGEIENLAAVIVRIDSPGGDYNAADEIYFALKQLKEDRHIPIVVSQGGYAASGGYFISLAGDKIVAEPTTITGSIGVLGGKLVLAGLWQKIGVNWETLNFGKNADILSINRKFSPAEQKIFNASLDEVYADFTQKVAENRPLTADINEIARGRVWLGYQAVELGLVDMLGGQAEALQLAKELAQLENQRITVVNFPKVKSFSEKLADFIFNSAVQAPQIISKSGVDIRYLKLFKRWQYDTVLLPFSINM